MRYYEKPVFSVDQIIADTTIASGGLRDCQGCTALTSGKTPSSTDAYSIVGDSGAYIDDTYWYMCYCPEGQTC